MVAPTEFDFSEIVEQIGELFIGSDFSQRVKKILQTHTVPIAEYRELKEWSSHQSIDIEGFKAKLTSANELLVRLPIEHAAIQGALDQEINLLKSKLAVAEEKLEE